jgi:hypothetical protein
VGEMGFDIRVLDENKKLYDIYLLRLPLDSDHGDGVEQKAVDHLVYSVYLSANCYNYMQRHQVLVKV